MIGTKCIEIACVLNKNILFIYKTNVENDVLILQFLHLYIILPISMSPHVRLNYNNKTK